MSSDSPTPVGFLLPEYLLRWAKRFLAWPELSKDTLVVNLLFIGVYIIRHVQELWVSSFVPI